MSAFQLQHILVPTDFSELALNALNHAATLANRYGSRITLLHVRENMNHDVLLPDLSKELDIDSRYDELARERILQLSDYLKDSYHVESQVIISVGGIASEVKSFVNSEKIDLVVMGTHGTKGIEEFFLGSNAYRVVNSVKCPVLTVQNADQVNYKTIVVPVDDTLHSREKLPYCVDLCRKYGASVKLLMIYRENTASYKAYQDKLRDQVENYFRGQAVEFETHTIETTSIAKEIIHFAQYMKGDLIVIMSEQETTITGMLLGPFSQQVVNHSPVPVLTIKPRNNNVVVDLMD